MNQIQVWKMWTTVFGLMIILISWVTADMSIISTEMDLDELSQLMKAGLEEAKFRRNTLSNGIGIKCQDFFRNRGVSIKLIYG